MISAYHQPPIPHVHHVHLYVQDLHRSLYFYGFYNFWCG
uniref:Uncharacterized protein n=1 Tax=uncultured firmicutes bacterium contig_61 TaxID=1643555 RepID=A0A141GNG5_9FIRM|nr:hypothetical protein [uncultured firmicutes bacterium contig_61]